MEPLSTVVAYLTAHKWEAFGAAFEPAGHIRYERWLRECRFPYIWGIPTAQGWVGPTHAEFVDALLETRLEFVLGIDVLRSTGNGTIEVTSIFQPESPDGPDVDLHVGELKRENGFYVFEMTPDAAVVWLTERGEVADYTPHLL